MANNNFDCCCHILPNASIPEVIAGICNYLRDHPGWSDGEIMAIIQPFVSRIEELEARVETLERG